MKAGIEIESMRMVVLKTAKGMGVLGNSQARVWVRGSMRWSPSVCARSSTRRRRDGLQPKEEGIIEALLSFV